MHKKIKLKMKEIREKTIENKNREILLYLLG